MAFNASATTCTHNTQQLYIVIHYTVLDKCHIKHTLMALFLGERMKTYVNNLLAICESIVAKVLQLRGKEGNSHNAQRFQIRELMKIFHPE